LKVPLDFFVINLATEMVAGVIKKHLERDMDGVDYRIAAEKLCD
jgi:hypothetical protein